jgi:integrase/recombinase XerD
MYGSDLISQFEASLRVANRSQRTIGQYLRIVTKLGLFLFARDKDLLTATTADIEAWQQEWTERANLADASQRSLVDAAHAFYRWALDRELLVRDPSARIRFFCRAPLPRIPEFDSVRQLVAAIDTSKTSGIRDRALIMFLYGSGLRISEALSIRLQDISLHTGHFRVLTKGSRERIHSVGPEVCQELQAWCTVRATWEPNCDLLWISRIGNPLPSNAVRKMLIRRQEALGINHAYQYASGISRATITPHSLRHAYATQLYSGGVDIAVIRDLLGHQRISTTMVYVHIDQAKSKSAIGVLPSLLAPAKPSPVQLELTTPLTPKPDLPQQWAA